MKLFFRWFGEMLDNVPLDRIGQIPGCSGVVRVIVGRSAAEGLRESEIERCVSESRANGLELAMIEGLAVHDEIKLGLPGRDRCIEMFKQEIKTLARYGIRTIIYNFTPAYDSLITNKNYTADKAENIIEKCKCMTNDDLRDNFKYFMERIIPVCESYNVTMALKPDDPALNMQGVPRMASTMRDLDLAIRSVYTPRNSMCMCTGAFGVEQDNKLTHVIRHFGEMKRIAVAYIGNVRVDKNGVNRECMLPSNNGDLDMYQIMKMLAYTCPDVAIAPGRSKYLWDDSGIPGYGVYDRLYGIAYLNGLHEAVMAQ